MNVSHKGCGRNSENQHAIKHYEKPHSDPHCLVVNIENWSVWCYICDDDVQYSSTGNLAQLVTNVKKQVSSDPDKRAPQRKVKVEESLLAEAQEAKNDKVLEEDKEDKEKNQKKKVKNPSAQGVTKRFLSVKGLSNLGNTCFFNAVVQNLSQTQLLKQKLNKVVEEKISLSIPCAVSSDLEPLPVQLEQPGSLTLAMCQLLNEIQESKREVVTPRELFTQVCKKAVRFKGYQQQDSQEFLRYLLDGMRAEEIKRVNSGILAALKKSGKSTDSEQSKTLIMDYEKEAPKNFIDQVFGGEMTSTVMCQECKTVSLVKEMFLDLSLPVSDVAYSKKNQNKGPQKSSEVRQKGRDSPVELTNGSEDMSTGAGSKYQQRKAKKQAKKQAKNQRKQPKFDGKPTLNNISDQTTAESSLSDHADCHSMKNVENGTLAEKLIGEDQPAKTDLQEQDHEDKQEEEEEEDDCETLPTSEVTNRYTSLSEEQNTVDGFLEDNQLPKVEQGAGDVSDSYKSTEEKDQLAEDLENMSLNIAFIKSENGEMDMERENVTEKVKEYTVVNQDPELAFSTLATRMTPEKQDCSVQSCLFQFTEVENLTENNSLLCVTCTKRQTSSKTSEGSKKKVYTDALKQMLISSPPPVLTLHLKRFQQIGYSVCKVNRHVSFPQILDLAPFCALNCTSVTEGDTQVLYSLYGIVEHSGTMRSGHYTAYVKTQPSCPSEPHNGMATQGQAEDRKGSWFHVSDSSVHPVMESKVQSSQAYLLFYERLV